MRYGIDLHVATDDEITAGHRPGIIRIGGVSIYFNDALYEKDITQLQRLREIVQVQINAIVGEGIQAAGELSPVHRPEILEPGIPWPPPQGHEVLKEANAPAEELAAPWIAPPPPQPTAAPEGQPVEEEKVVVLDESDVPF